MSKGISVLLCYDDQGSAIIVNHLKEDVGATLAWINTFTDQTIDALRITDNWGKQVPFSRKMKSAS